MERSLGLTPCNVVAVVVRPGVCGSQRRRLTAVPLIYPTNRSRAP